LSAFLRNIPAWLRDDLCHTRPAELVSRLRVKAGTLRRWLGARLGLTSAPRTTVANLFDLSQVPDTWRALLEANYQALRHYEPRPYAGPVAVLQASCQPLLRWHEPLLGWQPLLRGPVQLQRVPGSHDRILMEPCVRALARELNRVLEWARCR
jgi:hypothetical protein